MVKKNKHPRKKSSPNQLKKPRTAPEAPQRFRWRTDYADLSDKEWGWGCVSIRELFLGIVKKLHQLEDCSWDEIIGRKVHFIAPSEIVPKAQKRLKALAAKQCIPDDWSGEDLTSIRLTGEQRVWGFKVVNSFYLLWWDPKHTVYPVPKKHT